MDSLHIFNDSDKERSTLVCNDKIDPTPAQNAGIHLWQLPEKENHLDLNAFRSRCAEEGIHGVYIEPGPRWASALIAEQSVDYFFHYIAPKYLVDTSALGIHKKRNTQSINEAFSLSRIQNESFANDLLVRGWLRSIKQ